MLTIALKMGVKIFNFILFISTVCVVTLGGLPPEAAKQCKNPHERYSECVSGECVPVTCDDLDKSISCPFVPGPCEGGCVCEQGYGRDSNGICIKYEDCPAKPCRRNETWMSPCNIPCPYPRCPRDNPPPPCVPILPCYPGCQCKLNYLRNTTGHCILARDCPTYAASRY